MYKSKRRSMKILQRNLDFEVLPQANPSPYDWTCSTMNEHLSEPLYSYPKLILNLHLSPPSQFIDMLQSSHAIFRTSTDRQTYRVVVGWSCLTTICRISQARKVVERSKRKKYPTSQVLFSILLPILLTALNKSPSVHTRLPFALSFLFDIWIFHRKMRFTCWISARTPSSHICQSARRRGILLSYLLVPHIFFFQSDLFVLTYLRVVLIYRTMKGTRGRMRERSQIWRNRVWWSFLCCANWLGLLAPIRMRSWMVRLRKRYQTSIATIIAKIGNREWFGLFRLNRMWNRPLTIAV